MLQFAGIEGTKKFRRNNNKESEIPKNKKNLYSQCYVLKPDGTKHTSPFYDPQEDHICHFKQARRIPNISFEQNPKIPYFSTDTLVTEFKQYCCICHKAKPPVFHMNWDPVDTETEDNRFFDKHLPMDDNIDSTGLCTGIKDMSLNEDFKLSRECLALKQEYFSASSEALTKMKIPEQYLFLQITSRYSFPDKFLSKCLYHIENLERLKFEDKYFLQFDTNYGFMKLEFIKIVGCIKKYKDLEKFSVFKMKELFYEKEFNFLIESLQNRKNIEIKSREINYREELTTELENILTPTKIKKEVIIMKEKKESESRDIIRKNSISSRRREVSWLNRFPKENNEINKLKNYRPKPKWLLERPQLQRPYVKLLKILN